MGWESGDLHVHDRDRVQGQHWVLLAHADSSCSMTLRVQPAERIDSAFALEHRPAAASRCFHLRPAISMRMNWLELDGDTSSGGVMASDE